METLDSGATHRFEPHGLPDSSHGGIPDRFRGRVLFASGLRSGIRRIPNPHDQTLPPGSDTV